MIPHWSRTALVALAKATPPQLIPVWSTAIVAETWRILTLRAIAANQPGTTISRAAHGLWLLLDPICQIADASRLPEGAAPSPLRDPHDRHLWCAALNGGARYIVSHNTRDFPPPLTITGIDGQTTTRHHHAGVEFLTAIEFIEEIAGADAATLCGRTPPAKAIIRSQRSRT